MWFICMSCGKIFFKIVAPKTAYLNAMHRTNNNIKKTFHVDLDGTKCGKELSTFWFYLALSLAWQCISSLHPYFIILEKPQFCTESLSQTCITKLTHKAFLVFVFIPRCYVLRPGPLPHTCTAITIRKHICNTTRRRNVFILECFGVAVLRYTMKAIRRAKSFRGIAFRNDFTTSLIERYTELLSILSRFPKAIKCVKSFTPGPNEKSNVRLKLFVF